MIIYMLIEYIYESMVSRGCLPQHWPPPLLAAEDRVVNCSPEDWMR